MESTSKKTTSEQEMKENISKKNPVHMHEVRLNEVGLESQVVKGGEARALTFTKREDDDGERFLKRLLIAMNSLKGVQSIEIDCKSCGALTDFELKMMSENIKRMSCLQRISLCFKERGEL